MDFLMIGILVFSYLLVKLLADWCECQVKKS